MNDIKTEIIELMKDYSMHRDDDKKRQALIKILKENCKEIINENDCEYRFCWCTLSSYCGYFINRSGKMIVVESEVPIKYEPGYKIELKDDKKFLKDNYNIVGYRKLKTQNGYIINPDGSNSPYLKIKNREIKLATNVDVYQFMASSGWLKLNEDNITIAESFNDSIVIHHINNNPNDNREKNLIYLPKQIHDYAH